MPFALAAWSMWQSGNGPVDAETFQRLVGGGMDADVDGGVGRPLTREDAAFWLQLAGAVVGGLSLWSIGLAGGVALRREAARHAALVTFLFFALVAVPHGIGGWFLDPRPAGVLGATLAAASTASVVWLLATRQLADDVSRASFYRRRRRRGHHDGSDDGDGPSGPPVLAA
ncbi:MAG TPA: hypothetical protein VGA69_02375 [Nitriliruptorales bacterium]